MTDRRHIQVDVVAKLDEQAIAALQELYRALTVTFFDLATAVEHAEQRINVALSVYANEFDRQRKERAGS